MSEKKFRRDHFCILSAPIFLLVVAYIFLFAYFLGNYFGTPPLEGSRMTLIVMMLLFCTAAISLQIAYVYRNLSYLIQQQNKTQQDQ